MLVHISLTEGMNFDIKDYIQYIKMIEMTNAMLIMYEFLIYSLMVYALMNIILTYVSIIL